MAEGEKMKKQKNYAFGKDIYLLGKDSDGILYWLEAAGWDCDWYWGGGYVKSYTNNKHPENAKDIISHQHFDSLFFNNRTDEYAAFKEFFSETPFTDSEIWKLLELMKAFYIARKYSDMIHQGGAYYTTNPAKEAIQNPTEYDRINKEMIPAIMQEIYKIMEG